ncbi:MAG: DUF2804 domain-containing protein [Pseudomonadaceae bacterium]|jgi:hypothetical protein|nr:DUF2804 domain-containing protein [Pseudomonadaceae bacterium]
MQHEILAPLSLLQRNGTLTEPGWARQPHWHYQRNQVQASNWRIKEWDYYAVVSPQQFAFCLTASNLGYVGLYALCFVDLVSGRSWQIDALQALPLGRQNFPETAESGEIRFRSDKLSLSIQRIAGEHRLRFSSPKMPGPHGQGIDGELYFRLPPRQESLNIATSWPRQRKAFYYNSKFNCLAVSGDFRYAGKHYQLSPVRDLGVLDWGRGVWTYRNTWYWASASGFVDGEPFGLNFGYGFSDRSQASENLLLYRGRAHKLDQVEFHFDRKNWTKPWQISSNDGRVALEFVPRVDRNSKLNLLLIASEQHQVFGHFSGRVSLDNGQVLQLSHLPGFAEEVRNRW